MIRLLTIIAALFAAALATPAAAEVRMSFHSFNGSIFFGRYPHTFIVLEGTLEETGAAVNENYGFTAKRANTSVLRGPVEHMILIEDQEYIESTNRHFTVTISDEQYRQVRAEMREWRDAPGRYYELDTRNCVHFVGAMARIAGLRVEIPQKMVRRPKKWLNHMGTINPQLGATRID